MTYSYAAFATFPDRGSAQMAVVDLPEFGLRYAKVKLFECASPGAPDTILDGLMSNGTWAESDGRRGLTIGVGLGGSVGAIAGVLVWSVFEMSPWSGLMFGAFMGLLFGAVVSGIIGAGLVNPRLARTVQALQVGQVLVSVSCHTREEHELLVRLLRTGSLTVETDRPLRSPS